MMWVVLQYTSGGSAFIAAALWLLSAVVKLPERIERIDLGTWGGNRPEKEEPDDLDRLTEGLRIQSKRNAWAAAFASVAAILQGVLIVFHHS